MDLIDDSTHIVRRQLAASAGEFPADSRDEALLEIISRLGNDPMVVSLVISGLPDREFAFLEQILDEAPERQGTRFAAKEIA